MHVRLPPSRYEATMELGVSGTLLLAIFISLVLYFFIWRRNLNKKNMPPGPPPLPVLGSMLHVNLKEMPQSMMKLSETYDPVFTIYLSSKPAVVLVGYDCVKEALIDHREIFGLRGPFEFGNLLFKGYGVMLTNGERWKQIRRFSLSTLRNFGMGKKSIEEPIKEEARYLAEEIKTWKSLFDPTYLLTMAVSNVICSVAFGERFDYEDVKFKTLFALLKEMFESMATTWGMLLNVFPRTLHFLPGPHQKIFTNMGKVKDFIAESLESHKATLDPNCPRDFIDCFLIKMKEDKEIDNTEFHFENLFVTVQNLFFAGTETTSTTLKISLRILLKYPEVLAKVQKEIDHVVGQNRCPSVEDRSKMPYTDAVIHEIQRFENILPLGVPHAAAETTIFRGYTLPKDTTVFALLDTALNDPKYFQNPEKFDPSRFLDANGHFKKTKAFIPFLTGKRICLGEGMARMEIFLFLTFILQNFTLKSEEPSSCIDVSPLPNTNGMIPRSYNIQLYPR
ncbi:cytochrome P450 2B4-like [Dendropsophus ebraccatus]|uniref:cytochrome P450 2B4-like n=1 Tax=Dendropsophus ebraccatus TaxID=150705 RepID=UPI0038312BCF